MTRFTLLLYIDEVWIGKSDWNRFFYYLHRNQGWERVGVQRIQIHKDKGVKESEMYKPLFVHKDTYQKLTLSSVKYIKSLCVSHQAWVAP